MKYILFLLLIPSISFGARYTYKNIQQPDSSWKILQVRTDGQRYVDSNHADYLQFKAEGKIAQNVFYSAPIDNRTEEQKKNFLSMMQTDPLLIRILSLQLEKELENDEQVKSALQIKIDALKVEWNGKMSLIKSEVSK